MGRFLLIGAFYTNATRLDAAAQIICFSGARPITIRTKPPRVGLREGKLTVILS